MNFKDIPQLTRDGHYRADTSLEDLQCAVERYQSQYGLNIDPDFQRPHVWNQDKQTKFIEFILRGGNSARIIYLNHPGWMKSFDGEMVLVDGKQRLSAALAFLNNEIPVFDGHYFQEFTDRIHSGIYFTFCINNLKTRKEVLQWYLDLNTGGVVHTNEEIEKVRNLLDKE